MSKSAVHVAAPKTLRYEQDAGLPVAIEARSNRRSFWPANGNVFSPDATNVIRMTQLQLLPRLLALLPPISGTEYRYEPHLDT